MTKQEKIEAQKTTGKIEGPAGLELLRAPFPEHQISKLPKPTKKQTDEVRADYKKGIRCKICGGWHHPQVVHLDYVGHAALTDRLLDCDPHWNWEPLAFTEKGIPALDENGGMWIRLTVCGVTRYGYGHPDGKRGGDAIKEVIGDALRNAAMRFGAALDLWHKGQLHADSMADDPDQAEQPRTPDENAPANANVINADQIAHLRELAAQAGVDEATICAKVGAESLEAFPAQRLDGVLKGLTKKAETRKAASEAAERENPSPALADDEIPY